MILKNIYLFFQYLLIFIIALFVLAFVVITNPEAMQYTGEKILKENGVEYSKINGSLLGRIVLNDVTYTDAISIKKLQVDYNVLLLLLPTPVISNITIDELTLYPQKLPSSESNSSELSIVPFSISKIQMNKTKIIFDDETVLFDIKASSIDYKSNLDIKRLALELSTSYGDANLKGKIETNNLYASSSISPSASLSKEYLDFLDTLPKTLMVDINASLEQVAIKTYLNNLGLSSNEDLSLNDIDLDLFYFIEEDYFSLDTSYTLSYQELASTVKQKAIFTTDGNYSSTANATLIKQNLNLPFKDFSAEVSGTTQGMVGKIYADKIELDFHTKEYNEYKLQAKSKALALSFLEDIPMQLKEDIVDLDIDAVLILEPLTLNGNLDAEGLNAGISGDFELNNTTRFFEATLLPKPKSELLKDYKVELFSPLNFVYQGNDKQDTLSIDANMLNLTLLKNETLINAWGNLGSANFVANGTMPNKNKTNIDFSANIASINTLLLDFNLSTEEDTFIDGEVDINATLVLSDTIELKSKITMPWYIIKPDSQTNYIGDNLYLESTLKDKEITIDKYSLNAINQYVYSNRPSKISFDENATVKFEEFWIYDNLLVTGLINPLEMEGNLRLQSDSFAYNSSEGNITAKADISAVLKSSGEQSIEGTITLLEGIITYEPVNNHSISNDIIIIQDIKAPADSLRSISIAVNSAKPIHYKTKEIDIQVTPDLVILQEPHSPLALYGMLGIEEGEVTSSDKVFEFDKSEIYFNGANPINPYLNLNLHYHTLDYIDIEIYISNTLDTPVIILSSKPSLSQNDIMSYILFGEPADATFGDSEGSSSSSVGSILLATGLKQIFNDTTSIKIDTLNILTNEEGTLGYEIGTRFNKQIRMVYRNDTISSIILQYSLSKSVRIDIDVHETGQGINILYIKDF